MNSNVVIRLFLMRSARAARHVVTEEIVEKVHDMILADCQTKVHEVVETIDVSYGTAFNILHDNLGMKKLSARWVSRLLTVDNKRMRLLIAKQCLERYELLLQCHRTPHPPYSPDLAPSDYYLFPNLKRWLINKKFN